jgi:hypothetical protein
MKVHGVTFQILSLLLITSFGNVFVLSRLILKSILDARNACINCVYAKSYSCCSLWYWLYISDKRDDGEGLWVWGPDRYLEFGGGNSLGHWTPPPQPRQTLTWRFMFVCCNFEFFQLFEFIDLCVSMTKNASTLHDIHTPCSFPLTFQERKSIAGDKFCFLLSQQACFSVKPNFLLFSPVTLTF